MVSLHIRSFLWWLVTFLAAKIARSGGFVVSVTIVVDFV